MAKLFLTITMLALALNLFSQDNPAIEKPGKTYPALLDKEFEKGSRIKFPELDEKLILDLAWLGKVWGFLKYNHPNLAEGTYNWDAELLRFLNIYLAVNDKADREEFTLMWINCIGDISQFPKVKTKSKNTFSKQSLDWIETMINDSSLKAKLYQIHERRNQGEHFYVGSTPEIPTFTNEDPYANLPYPDDGLRLLSLYRFWNIIDLYFPYKHLTDKNWDEVLIEYIPQFLGAKNELEYELVVLKLIGEVHDTHANLWEGGNKLYHLNGEYYPPFHVRFVENQLIVDDYFNPDKAEMTGVHIGDIITHINGKSVEEIVDSLSIYYPVSNHAVRLREMSSDMLRSAKNEIDIEYKSSGASKKGKLTLYKKQDLNYYTWFKTSNPTGYNMLPNDILYLNLAFLNEIDYPTIEKYLISVKGVIIDVRNYPNFLMWSLVPYFQTTKKPFARFTLRNIHNPGEFIWTEKIRIHRNKKPFSGKLIVLVNEITQSLGELTAMAFKATGNATIIGSQTAGADGRIADIYLPGGLKTSISGYGVYYPDKTETQRIGIVPDIEVKPTIKGIKEGRDEVMERAMQILEEGAGKK